MTNLYDKYYGILKHIYNIMYLTNNEELKELSKTTILNTVEQLCEKDKKNEDLYNSILVEFGFLKKDIEKTVNNLDVPNVNEFENTLEIKESSEDLKNIENETVEEEKQETKELDKKYSNVDEYVLNKIYRNKNTLIGNEFQNIMRDLITSIKNNDEENILKNKNRYNKFVEDNKSWLDKEKMDEFFQKRYNEYKIDNEVKEENNNAIKKEDEPLKIKSVKKSYNSKLKNKALTLFALLGVGTFNPVVLTGVGIGAYYLYKKGIKNAKTLIEKNGLGIDENDNLLDSNGKIIKEEDIGKIKYKLVKRELSKINNSGRIDSNYKKNKLTSMLLKVPSNLFKSIKNKYEQIKVSKENISEEVNDMNKGMGSIK